MTYRERWIRAIARKPKGLFGRGHEWTYALMDGPGTERRMGRRELFDELVPDAKFPGNDAYLCMDRANDAFLTGSKSWIGYPSGAEVEDPLATNLQAVTLDMLAFGSLLRVLNQPTLAQRYEEMALDLRADPTEADVEAAREWVGPTLRGGAGSLNDSYVQHHGKVDEYLDQWFQALMLRLGEFSRGGRRFHDDVPEHGRKS
jgi:hypothetical protein